MESNNLLYRNICLSKYDQDCFNNYNQLNDMCISFYFEYLTEEKYSTSKEKFVLIDPVMVSTIYFDESIEDLYDMLFPLNLDKKSFIFLPINDNTNKYAQGGGTHWALLVYSKIEDKFFYFDSTLSYISTIDTVASKISQIIKYKSNNQKKKIEIVEPKSLNKKQFNSYDCGMFVLEFTRKLLDHIRDNLKENKEVLLSKLNYKEVFEDITQDSINLKRDEILNILKNLKK